MHRLVTSNSPPIINDRCLTLKMQVSAAIVVGKSRQVIFRVKLMAAVAKEFCASKIVDG